MTAILGRVASAPSGRRAKPSTSITAFDLFAGIGGFRAGAMNCHRVRMEFVGACEIDQRSATTYRAIFRSNGEYQLEDLRSVTRLPGEEGFDRLPRRAERSRRIAQLLPEFNLLTAGFPCQPHSLMGNRRGMHDERGSLFYDIAEIIRVMEPRHFVLENVRAIRSVNSGRLFQDMLEILGRLLGYNLRVWELNAADYGTPQVRRRLFFVGSREALPDTVPTRVPLIDAQYPTAWHLLEHRVDERYYLSPRILLTILKHEHKGYRRPAEINRLIARPLTRTMHKMHRASQDNYYSDAFIHGRYNSLTGQVISAASGTERIRRITPREAFRIQSFPEQLIDRALSAGISDTQLYMQTGNAVAPTMVRAVLDHAFGG